MRVTCCVGMCDLLWRCVGGRSRVIVSGILRRVVGGSGYCNLMVESGIKICKSAFSSRDKTRQDRI